MRTTTNGPTPTDSYDQQFESPEQVTDHPVAVPLPSNR